MVQTLYLEEIARPETEGDQPKVSRQVIVDIDVPKVGHFYDLKFGRGSLQFTKRSPNADRQRRCSVSITKETFGKVTCPKPPKRSGR